MARQGTADELPSGALGSPYHTGGRQSLFFRPARCHTGRGKPGFLFGIHPMSTRRHPTRRTFLAHTTTAAATSGFVPYFPWTATAFANQAAND